MTAPFEGYCGISSSGERTAHGTYIDELRSKGIVWVNSSGNESRKKAMNSPACDPYAVNVASSLNTDGADPVDPSLRTEQLEALSNRSRVLTIHLYAAVTATRHCNGDCSADGTVTVDELLTGIRISLGAVAFLPCGPAFDFNDNGIVEINEVVAALNPLLQGCF
jgi:hypothetical protein